MKINWKEVAKSEGYKSLKAAVLSDCNERIRSGRCFNPMGCDAKSQKCFHNYCNTFKWAIDKAKSFSIKTGLSIDKILTIWEKDRKCWYVNHYQDCHIPRLEKVLIEAVTVKP